MNSYLNTFVSDTEIRAGMPRLQRKPNLGDPEAGLLDLDFGQMVDRLRAGRSYEGFFKNIEELLFTVGLDLFALHGVSPAQSIEPFGNFPDDYFDRYSYEGFHQQDMVLLQARMTHLRSDERTIFQSDIEKFISGARLKNSMFEMNAGICNLMRAHRVYNTCALIVDLGGPITRYVFRVGAKSEKKDFRDLVEENLLAFNRLVIAIDTVGRSKYNNRFLNPKAAKRIRIAPRPLQLLEVLDKDCTLNQAAEVLDMSISTANQHIAAAKKAYQVETTHGLLKAAREDGLLCL